MFTAPCRRSQRWRRMRSAPGEGASVALERSIIAFRSRRPIAGPLRALPVCYQQAAGPFPFELTLLSSAGEQRRGPWRYARARRAYLFQNSEVNASRK